MNVSVVAIIPVIFNVPVTLLVPIRPPQNISTVTLNTTVIAISWNKVNEFFNHGRLRGYIVFYSKNKTVNERWSNITMPPSVAHAILTNLTAFTDYKIAVAGFTGTGVGNRSSEIHETTVEQGKDVHLFFL